MSALLHSINKENTAPIDNTQLTLATGQLRELRELLKLSMKSSSSFCDKTRTRISKHIDRLIQYEADYQQAISNLHQQSEKSRELESLSHKQEILITRMKTSLIQLEQENSKYRSNLEITVKQLADTQRMVGEMQARVEEESRSKEGWKGQYENGREQNKRLVELLGKMEHKCKEKGDREEELEEQVLQLREALQVMTQQVERIETDLTVKIKERDRNIKKLQGKCEMLEREKRMREDMEQIKRHDDEGDLY